MKNEQGKTGGPIPAGFVLWLAGVHVFLMLRDVKCLHDDQEGQDLVEYALLVGFLAVACVLVAAALGNGIKDLFWTSVATKLS